MPYWSTTTKNAAGVYFRPENADEWKVAPFREASVEGRDDYTELEPPSNYADWNGSAWVVNGADIIKVQVRAWGAAMDVLPPYYINRTLMNTYQDVWDATQREAFRASFEVGGTDRWTIMKDFVLAMRTAYANAGSFVNGWSDWDAAHPEYTKADFDAAWAEIQSWAD